MGKVQTKYWSILTDQGGSAIIKLLFGNIENWGLKIMSLATNLWSRQHAMYKKITAVKQIIQTKK